MGHITHSTFLLLSPLLSLRFRLRSFAMIVFLILYITRMGGIYTAVYTTWLIPIMYRTPYIHRLCIAAHFFHVHGRPMYMQPVYVYTAHSYNTHKPHYSPHFPFTSSSTFLHFHLLSGCFMPLSCVHTGCIYAAQFCHVHGPMYAQPVYMWLIPIIYMAPRMHSPCIRGPFPSCTGPRVYIACVYAAYSYYAHKLHYSLCFPFTFSSAFLCFPAYTQAVYTWPIPIMCMTPHIHRLCICGPYSSCTGPRIYTTCVYMAYSHHVHGPVYTQSVYMWPIPIMCMALHIHRLCICSPYSLCTGPHVYTRPIPIMYMAPHIHSLCICSPFLLCIE